MRALLCGLLMLEAACWSQASFTADCTAAGHCVPSPPALDDAGTIDAGEVDAGMVDAGAADASYATWADVTRELFPTSPTTDSTFTLATIGIGTNPGLIGGVLTPSGSVICLPYYPGPALEIRRNGSTRFLPSVGDGGWEGGVLLPDGTVLGLPYSAKEFLVIPPDGGTPRLVEGGLETSGLTAPYFEGGVVTKSGKVLLAVSSGPKLAVFDPVTERLSMLEPVTFNGAKQYAGAVLRADGESGWMVPRDATLLVQSNTASSSDPGLPLSGFAGGVLLPNGDAVLAPRLGTFTRVNVDGVVPRGPSTGGYFSAAWSTNGFAYAVQTDGPSGKVAIIDSAGNVTEVDAPVTDAGTLPIFNGSHYGFVARDDGVIVGCPFSASYVLLLSPTTRRTVPREVMLSPWLDKW
jgi:hypothetical protein